MRFITVSPSVALQNEVESFIISENENPAPYIVLPDTALVLGFQYRGRLALIKDDKTNGLAIAGITGLQNSFRTFQTVEPAGSILVKFKPGGAAAFFPLPLHELFEQSIPLDVLLGNQPIKEIEEQLQALTTDEERIQLVENFLLTLRRDHREDLMVVAAIAWIKQAGGNIRMAELAKSLHTSASPLEKRFRAAVGCSPKKYAGIIRFQTLLKNKNQLATPAERAYNAGYFDQAHFIKDFKRFTGQTPENFFAKTL